MNFKPLGDRLLVQKIEEEQKTASGIYIPDNAKEKSLEAIVKEISSEISEKGLVQVGDKVVIKNSFTGTTIKLDGIEYVVLESEDILGIMK